MPLYLVRWPTLVASIVRADDEDHPTAIQHVLEAFWKEREAAPEEYSTIEWLCWLDIKLIEAHPEAITMGEPPSFVLVYAFDHLIRLYEREGLMHEALAVAERVARFRNEDRAVPELRERLTRLERLDAR